MKITLNVLDCPGQCEAPIEISDITSSTCKLSWRPPINNGGSDVMHYIIEKRETSRLMWTVVASNIKQVSHKVKKKNTKSVYFVIVILLFNFIS